MKNGPVSIKILLTPLKAATPRNAPEHDFSACRISDPESGVDNADDADETEEALSPRRIAV
jgi:hypothetical protein